MIYISDDLTKFILLILNLVIILYLLSPLLLKRLMPNITLLPDIISGAIIIITLLVVFAILEINLNTSEKYNIKKTRIATIENFDNITIPTSTDTDTDVVPIDQTDVLPLDNTISLPQSESSVNNNNLNNKLIQLNKTATEKYVETLCNGTPEEIEKKCKKLTKNNCKLTKCCVLLDNAKCVSGSSTGPTFLTDDKNNKIEYNNYIYNSDCYGNCK